jgi:serine/threonine protein kinase
MPLSIGDKLGPYEILAPLGAGGMGEVYRARDSKLNRDVAIYVEGGACRLVSRNRNAFKTFRSHRLSAIKCWEPADEARGLEPRG